MGEYQADAGPMDALRTQLKAIRTESARIDPKARRAAVLETLPERMAALTSRVAAKVEARESQSADDSNPRKSNKTIRRKHCMDRPVFQKIYDARDGTRHKVLQEQF